MWYILKRRMLKLLLPKNIQLNWGPDFIKVEGPLGCIIKKRSNFFLAEKDRFLYLWATDEHINQESFYLAMIKNIILGVSKGYRHRLKLVGVGFKASIKEKTLILKIGFSHEVTYVLPKDITCIVSKVKGSYLLLKGIEKDRVQQIAKEIRSLRKPDAYKGKGIHYQKEILNLKKGKRDGK